MSNLIDENVISTDILTKLYNRTFFDKMVTELIDEDSFPIGIIMGDINGLKFINDTLGRTSGDNLIIKISDILKSSCSEKDLLFRWGGDEFIIVAPDCSTKYCEDLLSSVESKLNDEDDEKFKLCVSMGYSLLNSKEDSVDYILKEAEDRLNNQKILVNKSVRSSIVASLEESLQSKKIEPKEHTERVLKYAINIGKRLNLRNEKLNELALLAKLHDIGKMSIPDSILFKPSRLTADEYDIMKTHSEKGYRLCMMLPELTHIARGILAHHERWDGKGYPLGLFEDEIPLVVRIISVSDAFDAMTNDRIYNVVKTKSEAIEELKRCSGKQFDPKIVDVFCDILEKK